MDDPIIRPIETKYAGTTFRSRLEARWAVFFDALRMPWNYEMEGFNLDGTWYLPDFWLPDQRYWVEIKPPLASDELYMPDDYVQRLAMLTEYTEHSSVAIYGLPGKAGLAKPPYKAFRFFPGYDVDENYLWCHCPGCGVVGVQFEGRWGRNPHHKGCPYEHTNVQGGYHETDVLIAAYMRAMSREIGTE